VGFTTWTYPFNRPISFKLPLNPILRCLIVLKSLVKSVSTKLQLTNTISCLAVVIRMSKQILTSLATKSVLYGSEVVLGSPCGSSTLKETKEWGYTIYHIKQGTTWLKVNLHFGSSSAILAAPCSSLSFWILSFFSAYMHKIQYQNWEQIWNGVTIGTKIYSKICILRTRVAHVITTSMRSGAELHWGRPMLWPVQDSACCMLFLLGLLGKAPISEKKKCGYRLAHPTILLKLRHWTRYLTEEVQQCLLNCGNSWN
jgi:hypothetical protein